MCNIRGYRHIHCGHTAQKCISACRGTYGLPQNSAYPRCNSPGPTLVIQFDKSCRQCQYQAFHDEWQKRIDEVKERRDAFCSLLKDMDFADVDVWGCDDEDDSGLSFGDLAGSDDTPQLSTCEGDCAGWCNVKTCPTKSKAKSKHTRAVSEEVTSNWCDPASLRQERTRLNNEIEQLQDEFNRLAWEHWQQFVTGRMPRNPERKKRRRTKPKISGCSPLKEVMSTDDFSTPAHPFRRDSSGSEPDSLVSSSSDDGSDTSVKTPNTSPDTSPTSSPTEKQSGIFGDWPSRNIFCPLMEQAIAHARMMGQELGHYRAEAPMLSEEWMKNFERITTEEIKTKEERDREMDLLPDWGATA